MSDESSDSDDEKDEKNNDKGVDQVRATEGVYYLFYI